MSHPLFSPDIALSDLFFFGHLKHKLQGCSYDSANDLFSAITDLIKNLEKSLFHCIFDEWISCLHLVVESCEELWRVVESCGELWRVVESISKHSKLILLFIQ
jgi:hypothetical protein